MPVSILYRRVPPFLPQTGSNRSACQAIETCTVLLSCQGLLQSAAEQQPRLLEAFRKELARQLADESSAVGGLLAAADTGGGPSTASSATSTLLQVHLENRPTLFWGSAPHKVEIISVEETIVKMAFCRSLSK